MEGKRGGRASAPAAVVVVGASAGGVQAVVEIARGLPEDFEAAVLVALHGGGGSLARVLDRAGSLRAAAAGDGDALEAGRMYVAPDDHHLLVADGRVRALRRPKVNANRPSVDVLFHSAARSYGARTAGVVLSGTLTDGTLGLRAIKRRGGRAVVQADPLYEGMPTSALDQVDVDDVLPAERIAHALTMWVRTIQEDATSDDPQARETELEAGFDISEAQPVPGAPSLLRCPDCGGALWEHDEAGVTSYACHVGHAYSAAGLVEGQAEGLERALWSAVRQLNEHAALVRRLGKRMRESGQERSGVRFEARAQTAEEQASLIRTALLEGSVPIDADVGAR